MNQTIKHGGNAIFVWSCMTSCGISYIYKIDEKMKQDLYLSILQDKFINIIEWYSFNLFFFVIF